MKRLRLFIISIFILSAFQSVYAQKLILNGSEYDSILEKCPSCIEYPIMVCGDQNIGIGKPFRNNLFQGKPQKGFIKGLFIIACTLKRSNLENKTPSCSS